MLRATRNPPTPSWKFEFNGVHFTRQGEEQFIFTKEDGTADTNLETQRPGFVNRIMRYALANKLPLEEQDVLHAVYRNIASNIRNSYFSGGVAGKAPRVPGKLPEYQQAPIPPGLIEAARRQCGRDVAEDDDTRFLHALTASEWVRVLADWRDNAADPTIKSAFGPVWWYAIHALAISLESKGFHDASKWIRQWHEMVPCHECRIHFNKFITRRPRSWDELREWADAAHDWVSAHK